MGKTNAQTPAVWGIKKTEIKLSTGGYTGR